MYYRAPKFLRTGYGLLFVMENGLFQYKQYANKLYEIEENIAVEKIEGFKILRNYDVIFSTYYIKEKNYLLVTVFKESVKESKEAFELLESEMLQKMEEQYFPLKEVPFEDRMRLAHNLLSFNSKYADFTIVSYINSMEKEHKKEFLLSYYQNKDGFLELDRDEEEPEEEGILSLYFRSFSGKVDGFMREFMKNKYVKLIKSDVFPVTDAQVRSLYESLYMGYETELSMIRNGDEDMYEILTDSLEEDKRRYSLCAFSALLKVPVEEIDDIKKELISLAEIYDIKINFEFGNQIENVKNKSTLVTELTAQTRLKKNDLAAVTFFAGHGTLVEKETSFNFDDYLVVTDSNAEREETESNYEEEYEDENDVSDIFNYIV